LSGIYAAKARLTLFNHTWFLCSNALKVGGRKELGIPCGPDQKLRALVWDQSLVECEPELEFDPRETNDCMGRHLVYLSKL
jgi:hypothetical protein